MLGDIMGFLVRLVLVAFVLGAAVGLVVGLRAVGVGNPAAGTCTTSTAVG